MMKETTTAGPAAEAAASGDRVKAQEKLLRKTSTLKQGEVGQNGNPTAEEIADAEDGYRAARMDVPME